MFRPFVLLITLLLLSCAVLPAYAGENVFADPRLRLWADLAREGKTAEALTDIERDLVSSAPHPLALMAWRGLTGVGEYARERYAVITDPDRQRALSEWSEVSALYHDKNYLALLDKYPPTATSEQKSPLFFWLLSEAATDASRFHRALQYVDRVLGKNDDLFLMPWFAFDVVQADERVRSEVGHKLAAGGYLNDPLARRFLGRMLAQRPYTKSAGIAAAREWLQERPDDAFALYFLGGELFDAGRFEEAAAALAKAEAIFPFFYRWEDHAVALRKLGRAAEADRVIRDSVLYEGRRDKDETTALRRYQVEMKIDEDSAYRLLEGFNEKWRYDEPLTAARVDHELKLDRYLDALEYAWALAARTENFDHEVRLLNALTKAKRTKKALEFYHLLRKDFPHRTEDFYTVASDLLKEAGDPAQTEELQKDFAADFPESLKLFERRAAANAARGDFEKGRNEYRSMFEIQVPGASQLKKYAEMLRAGGKSLDAAIAELDGIAAKNPWRYQSAFLQPMISPPLPAASGKPVDNAGLPHLVPQIGHGGPINAVAVAGSHPLAATAASDGVVILWNTASNAELRHFDHGKPVRDVRFINGDLQLVTGADDGVVRVWNTGTGQLERQLNVLDGAVRCIVPSPAGDVLLVGGASRQVKVISLSDFTIRGSLDGHDAGVTALASAPDGRHAASGSIDKTIRIWDVATGELQATLAGHAGAVTSLAFAAGGKLLVSGSEDRTVRLWYLPGAFELVQVTLGGKVAAQYIPAASAHGAIAALSSGALVSVDFQSGEQSAAITTPEKELRSMAALGDDLLVAGSTGSVYSVSERLTGYAPRLAGISAGRPPVGFSPDGSWIIAATGGNAVHLWPLHGNEGHLALAAGAPEDSASWALSTDGAVVGVFTRKGDVVLYSLKEKREVSRLQVPVESVTSLAISTAGARIATRDAGGTVRLWEPVGGKQLAKVSRVGTMAAAFAFTPDGRYLVAGSEDGVVYQLEAATGAVYRRLSGATDRVLTLALSDDGTRCAVGAMNGQVGLWNLETGSKERDITADSTVVALAFAPRSHRVAIAASGAPVRVFDADSGRLLQVVASASSNIDAMAFSGNGRVMLTGSLIDGVRLWDVTNGAELAAFADAGAAAIPSAISPGGDFLVLSGARGTIRLIGTAQHDDKAALFLFASGDWAVVGPDGRFDTNNLEEIEGLHWVMPDAPFMPLPVEAFMRDYYEPRLLTRLLHKEKMTAIAPILNRNRVQPEVSVGSKIRRVPGVPDQVVVTVTAVETELDGKKSGLRDIKLLRDGYLVGYVDGSPPLDNSGRFTREFTVALPYADHDHTAARFTAYAFNSDQIKSRTSNTVAVDLPVGKPVRRAYLVAIGAADYDNPLYNLQFPPVDAAAYITTLTKSLVATGRFSKDTVIPVLLTNNGAWRAIGDGGRWEGVTSNLAKRDIVKAVFEQLAGKATTTNLPPEILAKLRKATPNDVVIIAFSGHGYPPLTSSGEFLLVTSGPITDINRVSETSVNTSALTSWLRDVDAGSLTLIIDACHSASAIDDDYKPGPMGSSGLGQLAYDKGIRILAGTQADNVAFEEVSLGHGLLTYVLLEEGLISGRAGGDNGVVGIKQWLNFGVEEVPRVYAALNAGSFVPTGGGVQKAVKPMQKIEVTTQRPALFDFRRQAGVDVLLKEETNDRPASPATDHKNKKQTSYGKNLKQ